MDFSASRQYKQVNPIQSTNEDQICQTLKKLKSQVYGNEDTHKQTDILIIYASGAIAMNMDYEIERGFLQKSMSENLYLCDIHRTKKLYPKLNYFVSPLQQGGGRIKYKVIELKWIVNSVNLKLENVQQIAKTIADNYKSYSSFIVVTGLDTICYVGTALSFMLENLSKLVICTGGCLPLSRMRNDAVYNLVECFSLISEASTINDVLIVLNSKGLRANRCIKVRECSFENVHSPNLPVICSFNENLVQCSKNLILPKPKLEFSLFTELSNKVKLMKLNKYECIESLAYDLKNPFVKGIVIQSYSFANIPKFPEMLKLFKEAFEDEKRRIIFINVSQTMHSKNDSLMKQQLKNYHIYYGADMTLQSALAKLAYLIGKGYPQDRIISLMQSNIRGELTQQKQQMPFHIKQLSVIQIIKGVINQYFPSVFQNILQLKVQNNISKYVIDKCVPQLFKSLFHYYNLDEKENQKLLIKLVENHNLLHKATIEENLEMVSFFASLGVDVNKQDNLSHSPQFYAMKSKNKQIIQVLRKYGGRVISPIADIFQFFIEALKIDDESVFILVSHLQFKNLLKKMTNSEKRTPAHIAALLNAQKCLTFMKQKMDCQMSEPDIYGFTPNQYLDQHKKKELMTIENNSH